MHGSLCLHRGALYVGCHEKTARVRVYDLDGHERSEGFTFRDPRAGRSVAAGVAVDDDRQVWVADTPCSRVRTFTLFGREVGGLGLPLEEPLPDPPEACRKGVVRAPVDVAVEGDVDEGRLVVACGGERRYAVQLYDLGGTFLGSLRPGGNPVGLFAHVRGVAVLGRFVYVAESGTGSIQVFRDGDFHFAFAVPGTNPAQREDGANGPRLEPTAVAPLSDGRMVVACAGRESAVLLVDGAGRLIRVLAAEGEGPGTVTRPSDVVVEDVGSERASRVAVIDRDGERVQVFTLEGRCYGAFAEQA